MTAADLAPCPFPSCGGEVWPATGLVAGTVVLCMDCGYEAPSPEAHNTLSRRAALFPELVAWAESCVASQPCGCCGWREHPYTASHKADCMAARVLELRAAEITPEVQR